MVKEPIKTRNVHFLPVMRECKPEPTSVAYRAWWMRFSTGNKKAPDGAFLIELL